MKVDEKIYIIRDDTTSVNMVDTIEKYSFTRIYYNDNKAYI